MSVFRPAKLEAEKRQLFGVCRGQGGVGLHCKKTAELEALWQGGTGEIQGEGCETSRALEQGRWGSSLFDKACFRSGDPSTGLYKLSLQPLAGSGSCLRHAEQEKSVCTFRSQPQWQRARQTSRSAYCFQGTDHN